MLRPHFANSLRLSLMGAWLMGTAFLWVVATENFRRVDAVLDGPRPDFHQRLEPLPAGEARVVLRFLASELNRFYFTVWGWSQLVLGGVILILSRRLSVDRFDLGLLGAMWVLSVVLALWVTPSIIEIGRQVDFIPRSPPPPQMDAFWRYHLAYTVTDLVKFGAGLFWLLRTGLKRA
ncbi:MAG: hypothetical protein OXG96_16830 [Acidobacteria bacterium]|nr:hypothetical protein [Acidobacteriota bacterium]